MKDSLIPGAVKYTLTYKVPESNVVPAVFPEAEAMANMPNVFASGYMIALMEWACIEALKNHIDENEGSVGVSFNLTHSAPTPPGFTVTIETELKEVKGRMVTFSFVAKDNEGEIAKGEHGRAIIEFPKFKGKVAEKAARLS